MTKRVECTVVRSEPLARGRSVVSGQESDPSGSSSIVPVSKTSQRGHGPHGYSVGAPAVDAGDDGGEGGPSGPMGIFGVYGPRVEVPRGLALDVAA